MQANQPADMDPPSQDGETITVPVVAETVEVGKREVETGRVTIQKTVTERDETVEALLKRQDVAVERVPVNREVQEVPQARHEGDTWIIPILEEVLVVEKRLVLKEELHIRTSTTAQPARQTVRLRSEQVEISETGPGPALQPPRSHT